jgi:tetratricopeptide (TPR) repeat protein
MQSIEESIRADIRCKGCATPEILRRIESALEDCPSAELWILRGDAIQLSDASTYTLEDVERSYERAIEFEPSLPDPYESLGYFHYAVMDDAEKAKSFFERAISLGGGESAKAGLREALSELRDRAFEQSAAKTNQKYADLFRRLGE